MNTLLLAMTLLLANPDPVDGSLLFIENGNKIVQRNTNSTITHVAVILKEDNDLWVYEAIPPKVRKIKLDDYTTEIDELNRKKKHNQRKVWIANPDKPLTNDQKSKLKEYLESQLNRRYSVGSYIDGSPSDGIHCGELVGEAFIKAGLSYTEKPCIDSPWDVWVKTKPIYSKRAATKN